MFGASRRSFLGWMLPFIMAAGFGCAENESDLYRITLHAEAREAPATGRVILYFIRDDARILESDEPAHGPFYESPQPIASVAVIDLQPGGVIDIPGSTLAFTGGTLGTLDDLHGSYRVQAVLDADETMRSPLDGPGNVLSVTQRVRLTKGQRDQVTITLSERVEPEQPPAHRLDNLYWIEFKSELLSAFYGRDVHHRAGVALPNGYDDPAQSERTWGTVYITPGFGGRHFSAVNYAAMLKMDDLEFTPQAVFILLDPDSPLGHHGFTDSPNHGPRGTALVTELIPHLERTFRLSPQREARLLYGHSSGGWTSLWLQLNWPLIFGGCWASAPDPIDFRHFQLSNLYEDENLYTDADGREVPSYREVDALGRSTVRMTTREENFMEHALHPLGGSGEQWDAWNAMFSPRDDAARLPATLVDRRTGRINNELVRRHWEAFDITRKVIREWNRLGPVVRQDVRIACGEYDSFYLERAVRSFEKEVTTLMETNGETWRGGYVWHVRYATHGNVVDLSTQRIHREMIEHLRMHNLGP